MSVCLGGCTHRHTHADKKSRQDAQSRIQQPRKCAHTCFDPPATNHHGPALLQPSLPSHTHHGPQRAWTRRTTSCSQWKWNRKAGNRSSHDREGHSPFSFFFVLGSLAWPLFLAFYLQSFSFFLATYVHPLSNSLLQSTVRDDGRCPNRPAPAPPLPPPPLLRPLLFLLLLPERGVEIGLTPPCSCAPPAAAVAVAEDEAGAETPPVAALSGSSEMRNTTPRSQSQGLEKTCDIR